MTVARADRGPARDASAGLVPAVLFVVLAAHYVLKTAREPLVLAEVGPEGKALATAAQALAWVPALVVYDALASRLTRFGLAAATLGAGAASLAAFAAAAAVRVPIGLVFHVWLGVFGLLATAQVWSLAADVAAERGDRGTIARVGLGGALGALVGSALAAYAVPALPPSTVLLAGAGLLLVALALHAAVERAPARGLPRAPEPAATDRASVVDLVGRDPYLRLVAVFTLLASTVGTLGEYVLDRALLADLAGASAAEAAAAIAGFKGQLYGAVNAAALALHLLIASRAMPLRATLALPALACLGGWGAAALVPAVAWIAVVKATDAALGHSLHGTLRHALFLSATPRARWRAKAFIDTALARGGDLLAGGVVLAGASMGVGTAHFAALNAALSAAWLAAVALVAREHGRREVARARAGDLGAAVSAGAP